jgi:hypothetical protein
MTVIETEAFVAASGRLMSEEERAKLVAFVASDPEAGDSIPETGGVRKLRWAIRERGKRGGARVIYYFHSQRLPLVMLDIYAKNEKSNLTQAERQAMKKKIPLLLWTLNRRSK